MVGGKVRRELATLMGLLALGMAATVWAAEPFEIVILPDTQYYTDVTQNHGAVFEAQTQWIVDNVTTNNIRFVSHLGDIVQHGGAEPIEWERAEAAMSKLDGILPFGVTIGNHDYDNWNDGTNRHETTFLAHFGPARFGGYAWYGNSPGGLNSYQTFQAGGRLFLHLALESCLGGSEMAWAQQVLDDHPYSPTIISMHAFLKPDGNHCEPFYSPYSGQYVFDNLIKFNSQVFLTVNGHWADELTVTRLNAQGLPVIEMLCNYQGYPNGGDGWLRRLRFVPDEDKIEVRTFSPWRNGGLGEYKTGPDSHFDILIDFGSRFEQDLTPPTVQAWQSAAEHGRGVGEVLLEIPDDGSFCEPRAGGISKLIVSFSEAIAPASFVPTSVEIAGLDANNESVDLGAVSIGISMRGGDTEGVITFIPSLPDYARYAVCISGVEDVAGNPLSGDADRIITALVGDVSSDLRVNAIDFSRVRAARTKLIDAGNIDQVRADVSCDGRVNATDLSRVRRYRPNDARYIDAPDVCISARRGGIAWAGCFVPFTCCWGGDCAAQSRTIFRRCT